MECFYCDHDTAYDTKWNPHGPPLGLPLMVTILQETDSSARAHGVCAMFYGNYTKKPTPCDLCENLTNTVIRCTFHNCRAYVHPWCAATRAQGRIGVTKTCKTLFREIYCELHGNIRFNCTPQGSIKSLYDAVIMTDGLDAAEALEQAMEESIIRYLGPDAETQFASVRDCFATMEETLRKVLGYSYSTDSYLHGVFKNSVQSAYSATTGFTDSPAILAKKGVPVHLIPDPVYTDSFVISPLPKNPPFVIDTLKRHEVFVQPLDADMEFDQPVDFTVPILPRAPIHTQHDVFVKPEPEEAPPAYTCFWNECFKEAQFCGAFFFDGVHLDEFFCQDHQACTMNPVKHGIGATTSVEIETLLGGTALSGYTRDAMLSLLEVLAYL